MSMNYNMQVGTMSGKDSVQNRLIQSFNRQSDEVTPGTRKSRKNNTGNQSKGTNIYAGDLNLSDNRIDEKRKEARKQAMKVIGEAFSQDKKVDEAVSLAKQKAEELKKSNGEALDQIKATNQQTENLKELYQVTDGSEEQSDLKLLERREDANNNPSIQLSEKEQKRLQEIDEKGLTEYQQGALENYKYTSTLEKQVRDNNRQIQGYNQQVTAIGISRLKSHAMVDAKDQADDIMDQANEEIKGMIVNDAKNKVDDKMDENKEKAEKEKEKDKEEQKTKDASKQKAAEDDLRIKKQIIKNREDNATQKVQPDTTQLADNTDKEINQTKNQVNEQVQSDTTEQMSSIMSEAQKSVEELIQKMQLTQDDIKGAEVDSLT